MFSCAGKRIGVIQLHPKIAAAEIWILSHLGEGVMPDRIGLAEKLSRKNGRIYGLAEITDRCTEHEG